MNKERHNAEAIPAMHRLVDQLTQGVLLLDINGNIVWANDAAAHLHGFNQHDDMLLTALQYQRQFDMRYVNHHKPGPGQHPLTRLANGKPFDCLKVLLSARSGEQANWLTFQLSGVLLGSEAPEPAVAALLIQDLTDQINAEKRFDKAFAANPAPALILRISDGRYIRVNQGFLRMTGYTKEEVVGQPFYELDVLHQAQHREEALRQLREHATIAQQEASVKLKTGDEKVVIVAGQPIELQEDLCMLFTFIDLDERKQTEIALRATEESLRSAFRMAPVPMMVCSSDDGRFLKVNQAFLELSGYSLERLLAKKLPDLRAPGQAWRLLEQIPENAGKRAIHQQEFQLLTQDGTVLDCLLSAEYSQFLEDNAWLCVLQDITERKRSEGDLMAAIEAVLQDTSWFSERVLEKLAQLRQPTTSDIVLDDLTDREQEVLALLCQGLSDVKIAKQLELSPHTVRNYVAAIYSKINVNRRSDAVIWGRERGLIQG